MAKGKGKGSKFEREICKRLSLWWTENDRDDVFWRSTTSGARATQRAKSGKKTFGQSGDIQATDPIGQILMDVVTLELKVGYGKACVADVLDKGPKGAKQLWEQWIDQVIEDHEKSKSFSWLLITKRDRRDALVYMPEKLYKVLEMISSDIHMAAPMTRFTYCTSKEYDISHDECDRKDHHIVIGTTLEQFLWMVIPLDIKKIHHKWCK